MELEKQVVSLELAKRLKELGVKQDGYWTWLLQKKAFTVDVWTEPELVHLKTGWGDAQLFSAFTVAELSGILPWLITRDNERWYLMIEKDQNDDGSDCWRAFYETLNDGRRCCKSDGTLADSLASLVVHLLENKLITV